MVVRPPEALALLLGLRGERGEGEEGGGVAGRTGEGISARHV